MQCELATTWVLQTRRNGVVTGAPRRGKQRPSTHVVMGNQNDVKDIKSPAIWLKATTLLVLMLFSRPPIPSGVSVT
eukprot:6933701-Heterocapsa_arctica.AAC.1